METVMKQIQYYFSNNTKGFYCKEVHGNNMPADAIEINQNEYNNFFEMQSGGKYDWALNSDTATFTYTEKIPQPLMQEQAYAQARQALIDTDYMMVADTLAEMPTDEQTQLFAYRKYLLEVMAGKIDLTEVIKLKTITDF